MCYSHIVWDFNGTLIDDVSLGISATNILLARRGLPVIDREIYYREFGFPVKDYYTRIGFDFEKESYEDIAPEWVVEYRKLEKNAPLRRGVRELIEAFAARGILQTVLSATEQSMLREQLSALGILSCFAEAVGREDVHATDKVALACHFAKTRRHKSVLLIGDTDHDAACASAAGFDCALVCGGHQPKERLVRTGFGVYEDIPALRAALTEQGIL